MGSVGPTSGINGAGYADYAGVFAGQNTEERGAGFSAILSEVITAGEEISENNANNSAGSQAHDEPHEEALGAQTYNRYKKYEYHTPPAAASADPTEGSEGSGELGQLGVYDVISNDIPAQSYEYYEYSALTGAQAQGVDYQGMIADALRDEIARMGAMAGAGYSAMPDGTMPMQGSGLEQMIISAASTGQASDAQIALFMLCMMMQTNQDSDFSMLMQMMATMLTQIQGDTNALRNSVMSSGYDQSVLGAINMNVFNADGSGSLRALVPLNGWVPTVPAIRSTEANRSPQLYRAVVEQFRVETTPRYQPRDGKSYCNIFVWDVTSAMGAEIPYRTDSQTGEPWPENTDNAISMSATRIDAWLERYGEAYGWREVDAQTAQYYANQGKPAVTTAGSVGHVQMVVPSRDGVYDPQRGVTVAQAGGYLTSYTGIKRTYSDAVLREKVRYWAHE